MTEETHPSDGPLGSQPLSAAPSAPTPVEPWSMIASTGDLHFAQSPTAYAVYSTTQTHGRWPLTPDGYNFAYQTYEAHRQSFGHGVAYTATGYQDPARLGLPTEPAIKSKSYAAPLSYVGSTRRIIAWASATGRRNPAVSTIAWVVAIIGLIGAWVFLLFWYAIIFGLFGVFVIPYRLVRRSQRKSTHVQQTTLATQQAMLQQMQAQQQALAQQIQAQQPSYYQPPVQFPPPPAQFPQPGTVPPDSPAIGQHPAPQ